MLYACGSGRSRVDQVIVFVYLLLVTGCAGGDCQLINDSVQMSDACDSGI